MPKWIFNNLDKGYTAASSTQSLEGDNLSNIEIFVRESIQNSIEAINPGEDISQVTIKISRYSMIGSKKQKIIDNLNLEELKKKSKNFVDEPKGYFKKGDKILDKLTDENIPIEILSIEDFGTFGLKGHWSGPVVDQDKNFYSLVFGFYRSDKSGDTLGSYGAGSQFFAKCSALKTAVYYSVINKEDSPDNDYSRAIAKGLFPEFPDDDDTERNDVSYNNNGFGYFGEDKTEKAKVDATPLINEHSTEWIESLGLPIRKPNETGTSIFILGCDFDLSKIEESIAKYWWPLWFKEKNLVPKIILKDIDGNDYEFNIHDEKFEHLKPFIDCYKATLGLHNEKIKEQKILVNQKNSGNLAYLNVDHLKSLNEFENKTAIIFNNFVLSYQDIGFKSDVKYSSLFRLNLSEELSEFYRLAQPETHDKIMSNQRVTEQFPWAERFVKDQEKKLKSALHKFIQLDKSPDQSFQNLSSQNPLNTFLKEITSLEGRDSGRNQIISDIDQPLRSISMNVKGPEKSNNSETLEVLLSLSDNAKEKKIKVRFSCDCRALISSNGSTDSELKSEIEIVNHSNNQKIKNKSPHIDFEIEEEEKVKVTCKADTLSYLNFEWSLNAEKIESFEENE